MRPARDGEGVCSVSVFTAPSSADWRGWVTRACAWWQSAPASFRWRQVGAATAGVLIAGGIGWWALRPQWAPLYTGLTPAAAGQMTSVLGQLKIPYQLANGGTAITVPASEVDQARVDLAQHHLPASHTATLPSSSSSMFSLGQTPAQTALAAQASLEQTLDQTLTGVAGVAQAHVLITEPPATLFGESGTPATASVFLTLTPGTTLTSSQVTAIQHLVAAAVSGLTTAHVTVVDQAGTFLSAPTPTLARGGVAPTLEWQTTLAFEESLDHRLTTMLDQIYGPGAAVVRTAATLNFQSSVQHATVVSPKTTLTAQQTTTKKTAGAVVGKAAGTATNVPTYPTGVTGAGPSSSASAIQRYAVSTTHTTTTTPAGGVQHLAVAVALNTRLTPAQQKTVTQLIQSAVGANTPTGITVTGMPFNTSAARLATQQMTAAARQQQIVRWAEDGGLVLAALLVLLYIRRQWRRMAQVPARTAPVPESGVAAPPSLPPTSPVEVWYQRDPEALARVVRTLIEGEETHVASDG